ncbi:MAG: sulfatase [Planctomycetaceae bacterium]|nr:sulfatase [Planctomycetaceae bacterium]
MNSNTPAPSPDPFDATRRHFFSRCGVGLGGIALCSLSHRGARAATERGAHPLAVQPSHFRGPAQAVIFLHMAGGPTQFETFSYKPKLGELDGAPPPPSLLQGKRFAFLKGKEKLLGPRRKFAQYGESGAWLSDLLPHHRRIVDDLCILNGMRTDVFNHGPAKIFLNTGSPQMGRPSIGAWVTYGIGSEADDLRGFVVLQSGPRGPRNGAQLWSSGFLPTTYQGVAFRKGEAPILNLRPPSGIDRESQREFVTALRDLNALRFARMGDPEIRTRIAAYEMAYRMQTSAPELMNLAGETRGTLEAYAVESGKPSFGANCLLARRLVERGVRFVQLYHTNWDHHGGGEDINTDLPIRCRQIDQPIAALITDLKQRGLLDKTLVIWGGEFGRTPMGEERKTVGRDHHIEAYSMWMAGGGIRGGMTYGKSDELGMGVEEQAVHVHDLQATLLHCLGLDHTRLTVRFQGREFRLTDVHGRVVKEILA